MAKDDVYVVTGTQLNRRVKDPDGDWEPANLTRGTEFREGDTFSDADSGVTAREIKRWLEMQPRMVVSKKDLQKAQAAGEKAAQALAEAHDQIAQLQAELAAARAGGADVDTSGSGGSAPVQPAANASADDWRAYVKATHPDADPAEVDATSRDDLRKAYGS